MGEVPAAAMYYRDSDAVCVSFKEQRIKQAYSCGAFLLHKQTVYLESPCLLTKTEVQGLSRTSGSWSTGQETDLIYNI